MKLLLEFFLLYLLVLWRKINLPVRRLSVLAWIVDKRSLALDRPVHFDQVAHGSGFLGI